MSSWEPERPPKGTLASDMLELREALAELGRVIIAALPKWVRRGL